MPAGVGWGAFDRALGSRSPGVLSSWETRCHITGRADRLNHHPDKFSRYASSGGIAFGPLPASPLFAGYRIGEEQSGGNETILQHTPLAADAAVDRAPHDFISQGPRLYGCYDQRL